MQKLIQQINVLIVQVKSLKETYDIETSILKKQLADKSIEIARLNEEIRSLKEKPNYIEFPSKMN